MRRRDLLLGLGSVALVPGTPRRAAAQVATPTSGGDTGSFGSMLAVAPDILTGADAPVNHIAQYANPGLQLATLGEPPGGTDFSAWSNANYWLVFPSGVAEFSREPRRRDTFGFEARQVDHALEIGEPPSRVKFLRGRFDLEEVRAALTASGYAPVEVPGAEVFSWAAEPELDVESDVSQLGVGNMNNAAILPDGSLIFSGYLERLREGVAAATGDAPVLGDRAEVAELIALLDPAWATGYLLTPDAVRMPSVEDVGGRAVSDEQATAIATMIAGSAPGEMPRPELVAVGVTAGGPWPEPVSDPEATPRPLPPGTPQTASEIALLFADRGAAEVAAPIVEARLREAVTTGNGVPYREFFPSWEVRVDTVSPALVIRLESAPDARPGRVLEMMQLRDLLFIAWEG